MTQIAATTPQREHLSKLSELIRLVRAMSVAQDTREIYDPALSALQVIAGVRRSSIVLIDASGTSRFAAARGLSETYKRTVEGHFPWLPDERAPKTILIEDVEREPSLASLLPALRSERIRALAFLPLLYRDRLLGKFVLYFEAPHTFGAEEVELGGVVAGLVAFAIERVRLHHAVEESDRRKDVFLATLAHELRNPLAPAATALALMAEHPSDPAALTRARVVLDRSVRQIVRLVDDLLDVSRLTRDMIAIERTPVDLTSIVHHAVATTRELVASQRQELTMTLEPLCVEGDELRLEQVITNLVHNASKYTPKGGHIWVSTRASNGGVELRVRDDGIGIAPDLLPRLFDVFVQADRSLARTRGGLGIGLTIVKRLVELHGGTVRASSEGEGRGAELVVWLPGRIDVQKSMAAPAASRAPGARKRILVVDDNEDAATMLAMLLGDWGHEVTTAGDGPAAIEAARREHPDVVLLDLGLPRMTGYEVAEHLRAMGETRTRIIAVSGYGQPQDIARSRASGCDAHLAKPVDLDALHRILEAAPTGA